MVVSSDHIHVLIFPATCNEQLFSSLAMLQFIVFFFKENVSRPFVMAQIKGVIFKCMKTGDGNEYQIFRTSCSRISRICHKTHIGRIY